VYLSPHNEKLIGLRTYSTLHHSQKNVLIYRPFISSEVNDENMSRFQ